MNLLANSGYCVKGVGVSKSIIFTKMTSFAWKSQSASAHTISVIS